MNLRKSYFIFFLIFVSGELYSRESVDTSINEKKGWLIYWHDKIIWVEASINKHVKEKSFFKVKEYHNGLNVSNSFSAPLFQSIAKGHSIKYPHNDNSVQDVDSDSIWIIPVKVKVVSGFVPASETMSLTFSKDGKETFINFKGIADYNIRKIDVLRRKDRRRLKRVQSYQVL